MAKESSAPKKQRWYKLVAQAYRVTAPHDKWLLPGMIAIIVGGIAAFVGVGLLIGNTFALVYSSIFGLLSALLGAMYFLTRRFERNAYQRMEGQPGASLAIAQAIRSGWAFEDEPVNMDPRSQSVVFQGVGKGGIVLLAEGGTAARKAAATTRKRIEKLVPGVPVTTYYVGTGEGEVRLATLQRTIRRTPKALKRDQQATVKARLKAIGGTRPPLPKGIDPLRARPDRKGMR